MFQWFWTKKDSNQRGKCDNFLNYQSSFSFWQCPSEKGAQFAESGTHNHIVVHWIEHEMLIVLYIKSELLFYAF